MRKRKTRSLWALTWAATGGLGRTLRDGVRSEDIRLWTALRYVNPQERCRCLQRSFSSSQCPFGAAWGVQVSSYPPCPPPPKKSPSMVKALHLSSPSWDKSWWIDTFIRTGWAPLNQQVSASETLISEHLSARPIGWALAVRHVSVAQVKKPRWVGPAVAVAT